MQEHGEGTEKGKEKNVKKGGKDKAKKSSKGYGGQWWQEQKWNTYKTNTINYINNVESILNTAIYSQFEAKKEIQRIIAQWINGESKGYCFGFEGPPGTGKTSLAKQGIAKCLKNDDRMGSISP